MWQGWALTSDPWLCSQSAREHGLQKCGLCLRPLAKIMMHFLNVSHLMTKPTKWPLCPAKTQISLDNRPVWSESSQCAQWVAEDPIFPSYGQRRLWSDWADAQAHLCLRWAQWPFCWFCHAAAHVYIAAESLASTASLTADPGVAGSTPARPHIVCWNWSCAFFSLTEKGSYQMFNSICPGIVWLQTYYDWNILLLRRKPQNRHIANLSLLKK